jgi:hypothetical protein
MAPAAREPFSRFRSLIARSSGARADGDGVRKNAISPSESQEK